MTNTLRQKNQRARARGINAFSDVIQGKMCAEMNVINRHGVILQWLRKAAKIVFEIITWSSGAKNQQGIDLFSLYILFSHFRPRDATRGNSFFQMSSYARANLRITNEKTKGKFP